LIFPKINPSLASFSGFEGGAKAQRAGFANAPMQFDQTIGLVFAAQLQPSAPTGFIHFV
jgi:hypothetical protein